MPSEHSNSSDNTIHKTPKLKPKIATESEVRALIRRYEGVLTSRQTNDSYDEWRKIQAESGIEFTPDP